MVVTEFMLATVIAVAVLLYIIGISQRRFVLTDAVAILASLYLIVCYIREQSTFFNPFNVLMILFVIIYTIADILWGLRLILSSIPYVGNGVLKIITVEEKMKNVFNKKLAEFGELFLIISVLIITGIQILGEFPHKILSNHSSLEIIGFSVGIISLYGIYIAFLQFLTENDKLYFLGYSKGEFLLEQSIWTQITKSKFFILNLLMIVIIPILYKAFPEIRFDELVYLWQACFFAVLVVYIFLLKLSIKVVYLMFSINIEKIVKDKDKDEDKKSKKHRQSKGYVGVEQKIINKLKRQYYMIFWKVYKNERKYKDDWIVVYLDRNFGRMDKNDFDIFLTSIFDRQYFDNNNIMDSIDEKINKCVDNNKVEELRKLFNFYKEFCINKWTYLTKHSKWISEEIWREQITQDINVFGKLMLSDESIYHIGNPENNGNQVVRRKEKEILGFLWRSLLIKAGIDLNALIKETLNSTGQLDEYALEDKEEWQKKYLIKFEKFKWKKIIEKYESMNIEEIEEQQIKLPVFRKISEGNVYDVQKQSRQDFDNSMLYSKVCFEYLEGVGGLDLQNDKKSQNLILSMNEEYRLAYMLFQLFEADYRTGDNGIEFCDREIRVLMKEKGYREYLYLEAVKIISGSNIGYRINDDFLYMVWDRKDDEILAFEWFEQFVDRYRDRQTNLKIIYVQWLLSGETQCRSRIKRREFKDNKKNSEINNFCIEYLRLIDYLPSIFNMDSVISKENSVYLTTKELIFSGLVNFPTIVRDLSMKSIMILERILRLSYHFKEGGSNYTAKMFIGKDVYGEDVLWFNEGLVGFYILKIEDAFYGDLFKDKKFTKIFSRALREELKSKNISISEYVLSLSGEDAYNRVSVVEKVKITNYLEKILYKN